ncbi:basement membrane-specific heparan sulfate proteoglycan core protein-like isoform X3 [Chiloscyllium plagiosum]|uniref:basement membrane-specific heparan sulfate proteoglycan core protein-like isoform X3 n=1 Tax=Chiloscyllium plagiosum TaxID=36176 RepID=UPI001CB7F1BA|nr:basement membrane-specific heparan sulfate proteoglycan core protein-like isoform X3 [Chiloscyllium plagiosum]
MTRFVMCNHYLEFHVPSNQRFSKETLSLEAKWPHVLRYEKIVMNCRTPYQTWWGQKHFQWFRNNELIKETEDDSFTIESAEYSDEAPYRCELTIYYRKWVSNNLTITVSERFAKPVLMVEPAAEVFEGLHLTLTCTVQAARPSIRLHYLFYRGSDVLEAPPDHGNVYTINAAATDVSGNYSCEAIEMFFSLRKRSEGIHISVKQTFTIPKLTVHPEGQVFDGQWVKLVCSVEANMFQASLQYSFYRNGVPLQSPSDHSDYISESPRPADSGTYHCEVTDGKVWKCSNQLHLSIRRIPVSKPELIIQPGKKLVEGNIGSLICSVSKGSLPIYYHFYKGSSMELYWELSNSTELVYNIGSISRRDEGLYHCSVENGVTGHQHSEDIEITVIIPVTDAELISSTNGTEVHSGEWLVLWCRVREGTEPQFIWYRDNVPLRNDSGSYHVTANGGELAIHSFQRDDVGRYHCAAINKGSNNTIFNVTSDYIEFTLRARSYSMEITALLLSVLLFAGLIVLACFVHRRRHTGKPSTLSQPRRSQSSCERTAVSNLEYAVVGEAHNADNNIAELVYSEVTIKKRTKPNNSSAFSSDVKKDAQTDLDEYCITYATLNLSEPSQEEDGADGNVYANIPPK